MQYESELLRQQKHFELEKEVVRAQAYAQRLQEEKNQIENELHMRSAFEDAKKQYQNKKLIKMGAIILLIVFIVAVAIFYLKIILGRKIESDDI